MDMFAWDKGEESCTTHLQRTFLCQSADMVTTALSPPQPPPRARKTVQPHHGRGSGLV